MVVLHEGVGTRAATETVVMTSMTDDQGYRLANAPLRRIVSLVPSLTEAVALSAPGALVGATDWCTHPAGLQVRRVRGTKNPDLDGIAALLPDLVIVNEEENRPDDVAALRQRGIAVWVTDIRTVEAALASLGRLLDAIEAPHREWLDEARAAWLHPLPAADHRLRAVVPIWRRPWMALGQDTYAGDVLARLGVDNVLVGDSQRYPRIDLGQLPPHDLVVLPDEPYQFGPDDGPEAFPDVPAALVDGRSLTWYGPAMTAAPERLVSAIRVALDGPVRPHRRPEGETR